MQVSIETLYECFLLCSGISTDTRNIQKDALFVALKGPHFNANTFAEQALALGAKYVLVDEENFVTHQNILLVEDCLQALQNLANFHRKNLTIPVIGLTGSNGKTTSKELIKQVLATKFNVFATKGNLNNHIGVPLSVLSINATHEIAVIEMGANHQQEIAELCAICEPTHGYITNIGKAHLEGFGGIAGVRKGKGELYDFLKINTGKVFLNKDAVATTEMLEEKGFDESCIIKFSSKNNEDMILKEVLPTISFLGNHTEYSSHLTGFYNFENMAAAFAIGQYFGVNAVQAFQSIAAYAPDNNRSQYIQKGSNQLLMDAYNANPSSMKAAIENFNQLEANKKMVILGDMFELGDEAQTEHQNIGLLLKDCQFQKILLVGKLMEHAVKVLPISVNYFPDKFGLHLWLQDHPSEGYHVLVKGSRGIGLESVLPFFA